MILRATPLRYALVLALYFAAALNYPFVRALRTSMGGPGRGSLGDLVLILSALLVLLFLLFYLTAWRGVTKPVAYFLLLTAAPASCAVQYLGTHFTPLIIRSVVSTDLVEVGGLLSPVVIAQVLLLGVAPCLVLHRVELVYPPLGRLLAQKGLALAATVVLAAALYLPNQLFFNAFADNAANHRLKSMAIPFNYLGALGEYLGQELGSRRAAASTGAAGPDARVRLDAEPGGVLRRAGRRTVVIFVLGESARARSFSLNGYARETNPRLRRQQVVSFTRFNACATATAEALPCLFSSFGERDFSFRRAEQTENLLDVAQRAGYQVTWFENGMGTQSVTRGVGEVNLGTYYEAARDRVLIDRLPGREALAAAGRDQFIVLHQRGSHGPDYAQRYTAEYRVFTPDCDSSVLSSCSHEAVVNAYDNSIIYTDANLDDAIEYLKGLGDGFDTALLYVSDHGESTGEDGWYMHGLPKALAPDDQVRVPFIAWFSRGLQAALRLDVACVQGRKDEPFSQDNVFHSTVGLLDIRSTAYQKGLDIFEPCRSPAPRP